MGVSAPSRARLILLASVAVAAAPVTRAWAQPPSSGPTPAAPATSGTAVQEVVVTAQRRREDLQKSSLVVSVVSAQALSRAGVSQIQDLNAVVPGLQLGTAGQTAQPFIRGVGNSDNTGFAVSGVAFNLDGIYVGQPNAYASSLFDVQNLEVLKGPQGTLYGRNATGGAINIITNAPGHDFGGYAGVEAGDYGLVRANGAVNLPVSDTLALRAAFQVTNRNGYYKDGSGDDKTEQGRLSLLYTPIPALSVLVRLEASHQGGVGSGATLDEGGAYSLVDPWAGPQSPSAEQLVLGNTNQKASLDQNVYSASADMEYKLGAFKFTFLPAFRDDSIRQTYFTQGFETQAHPNTYQEINLEGRVAYESDRLKWVAGLYFFRQHQTVAFNVNATLLAEDVIVPKLDTESYAAFTQATFSLTPTLRLIGGLRYSHENEQGYGSDDYTVPIVAVDDFAANVSSDSTDYKAGIEYDLARQHMLYATVSTGYKAGGFFPSPSGPYGTNTFKPERLTAYELGLRNRFFDQRLQVNLEGFYWNYSNKQETFGGLNGIGLFDNVTRNAGAAVSRGADLDVVWRATPADTFHAVSEYLDAKYDSFTYATPSPSGGCPTSGAAPAITVDCSGMQLPRSPNWSGDVGYDHLLQLARGATVDFAGDVSYGTSRWLSANYGPELRAPGYAQANLYLTYTAPDRRWSLTGYVRNLTDAAVAANASASLLPNVAFVSLNPPRTFGAEAKVNF